MHVHRNLIAEDQGGGSGIDLLRTEILKPALASIPTACKYLGDVSRAKFYADVLPLLESVHIGRRLFVVVASMDRFIDNLKQASAENQNALIATQLSRHSSPRGALSDPRVGRRAERRPA